MPPPLSLERFKAAQASSFSGFETARAELESGHKSGHWIWYIFPQLAGLGRSSTARAYGLRDLAEAIDYLRDDLLRTRLQQLTGIVARQLARGTRVTELMGGQLDALKLVSSLTLFEIAARELARTSPSPDLDSFAAQCAEVLGVAAAQGLPRCAHTLANAR